MLSEHRDRAAAKAFFRSARTVTGTTPARVTTDGHDAYPRAIRTELGRHVRHRTNAYLNNGLEQDPPTCSSSHAPLAAHAKGSNRPACLGDSLTIEMLADPVCALIDGANSDRTGCSSLPDRQIASPSRQSAQWQVQTLTGACVTS